MGTISLGNRLRVSVWQRLVHSETGKRAVGIAGLLPCSKEYLGNVNSEWPPFLSGWENSTFHKESGRETSSKKGIARTRTTVGKCRFGTGIQTGTEA